MSTYRIEKDDGIFEEVVAEFFYLEDGFFFFLDKERRIMLVIKSLIVNYITISE